MNEFKLGLKKKKKGQQQQIIWATVFFLLSVLSYVYASVTR